MYYKVDIICFNPIVPGHVIYFSGPRNAWSLGTF